MRILIVEDLRPLRAAVVTAMRRVGWAVDTSEDGEGALQLVEVNAPYDVIVLDLTLPGMDGLEVLKCLRAQGVESQILILSAKRAIRTRVQALDLGADDYVTKPFSMEELVARVRALGRRINGRDQGELRVGGLEIRTSDQTARWESSPLELTPREYAIVELLALKDGQVVSRQEICSAAFDGHVSPDSNTVEVYIGYIRKKLAAVGSPPLIHTRRGLGYVLEAPGGGNTA